MNGIIMIMNLELSVKEDFEVTNTSAHYYVRVFQSSDAPVQGS